jgi:signal peptidase I
MPGAHADDQFAGSTLGPGATVAGVIGDEQPPAVGLGTGDGLAASQPVSPSAPQPPEQAPGPGGPSELLPGADTSRRKRRSSSSRQLVEWLVLVGAALLIAVIIKTFLFQAFYIPSESMEPTFYKNDRILVNKLSYHMHPIHRGDIVVFKAPPGEESATIKDLVKRVVGLPGELVEARNGAVYINGRRLDEPYVLAECPSAVSGLDLKTVTVPPGHYFLMGDNRCHSKDSRAFGPIARSAIIGRAFVRIWPLSRFKFL